MLARMLRPSRTLARVFSTATTASVAPRRRGGSLFSSFTGFLFGFAAAGGLGYVYLLDTYETSTGSLLSSMETLERSTHQIHQEAKNFHKISTDVEKLKSSAFTRDEAAALRKEIERLRDEVEVKILEIKNMTWELEKSTHRKQA